MIRTHILVCTGTGCTSNGSFRTRDALLAELKKRGLDREIEVVETGCMGRCDLGPVSLVHPDGTFYKNVQAADVPKLVEEHFLKGRPYAKLLPEDPETHALVATQADFAFFNRQIRIVRDNCGVIDPENIEEYIARDGFTALGKVLTTMKPEQVIAEIKASGLRGRGGAGFPTGKKWEIMRQAPDVPKYVVCNADEGDPGAFMNRSVLEGDPLQRARRHGHRRVCHGLQPGFHLYPRRVRPRREAPAHRDRTSLSVRASWAKHPGNGLRFRCGSPHRRGRVRLRRGNGSDAFGGRPPRSAATPPTLSRATRPLGQADQYQ